MLYEIERLKCSQMKTGDKGHALEKEVTDLREKLKETQGALAHTVRWVSVEYYKTTLNLLLFR